MTVHRGVNSGMQFATVKKTETWSRAAGLARMFTRGPVSFTAVEYALVPKHHLSRCP